MTCGKGRIMSEKTNKVKGSRSDYLQGLKDGLPIGLGYLSVSFAFGITAVGMKIPPLAAILISMTCLTSAGQVAGIGAIAAGGGLFEIALAQLIINLRYSLMSLSLSQKLSKNYNLFHRLTTSFGVTDEVFAVASVKPGEVTPAYMYGLITLPYIMWAAGTATGAMLGDSYAGARHCDLRNVHRDSGSACQALQGRACGRCDCRGSVLRNQVRAGIQRHNLGILGDNLHGHRRGAGSAVLPETHGGR